MLQVFGLAELPEQLGYTVHVCISVVIMSSVVFALYSSDIKVHMHVDKAQLFHNFYVHNVL